MAYQKCITRSVSYTFSIRDGGPGRAPRPRPGADRRGPAPPVAGGPRVARVWIRPVRRSPSPPRREARLFLADGI